jgi:hypothetical protein
MSARITRRSATAHGTSGCARFAQTIQITRPATAMARPGHHVRAASRRTWSAWASGTRVSTPWAVTASNPASKQSTMNAHPASTNSTAPSGWSHLRRLVPAPVVSVCAASRRRHLRTMTRLRTATPVAIPHDDRVVSAIPVVLPLARGSARRSAARGRSGIEGSGFDRRHGLGWTKNGCPSAAFPS